MRHRWLSPFLISVHVLDWIVCRSISRGKTLFRLEEATIAENSRGSGCRSVVF